MISVGKYNIILHFCCSGFVGYENALLGCRNNEICDTYGQYRHVQVVKDERVAAVNQSGLADGMTVHFLCKLIPRSDVGPFAIILHHRYALLLFNDGFVKRDLRDMAVVIKNITVSESAKQIARNVQDISEPC